MQRSQTMIIATMTLCLGIVIGFLLGQNSRLTNGAIAETPSQGSTTQEAYPSLSTQVPKTIPAAWQDEVGRAVLVEFYATWCPTCQYMEPHVLALGKELPKKLKVVRLDVDNPDTQKYLFQYQINGTPTYFIYDHTGKLVHRSGSVLSPTNLRGAVMTVLDGSK